MGTMHEVVSCNSINHSSVQFSLPILTILFKFSYLDFTLKL